MTRSQQGRKGFSLIEVLTVISIIAILAAIMVGGVGRVRVSAQKAQAMADINALSTAIQNFKTKFNVPYIPAGFTLRHSYASNDPDLAYLKRVFPQIDANNTGYSGGPVSMSQNQSLIFFLTGSVATNYTGFSSDRVHPFSTGGLRIGPFIDITASKINGNHEMVDPWGTPFAYFTSIHGNDYPAVTFTANGSSVSPFTEAGRFVQQKSFQIISAGPNRIFGPGGDYRGANAAAYRAGAIGGDDLSNFAPAGNLQQ